MTSEISDCFFHQSVYYIVQFVYNFLVVSNQFYMENTHFIDLDVLTFLIIFPRTGLRCKNSKNVSIQIGLKIAEKADAIEIVGAFVGFDGVKRMIKEKGRFTAVMLWQNTSNFVTNCGYKEDQTQKNTSIIANINKYCIKHYYSDSWEKERNNENKRVLGTGSTPERNRRQW